jgi:TolC family type I secretion outer membrane protein
MALRKFRLRALAATVAVCALSMAGSALADTLADAIAKAYVTNPQILAQRAALRALDESYVQARGAFGVTASGSIGSAYTDFTRDSFDFLGRPDGRAQNKDYTDNGGIAVVQPLYTGGRLTARLKGSEAQIKAGREALRRAELDLLTQVTGVYVGVRRDEDILKISDEAVAALQKMLDDAEAKYDVRQVTRTDVEQARARLAAAKTQALTAKAQLAVSRAQYNAVVGQYPGTLEREPDALDVPGNLDAAFDAGEHSSPQLLQAAYTEASSRARKDEARANRLPQVSGRLDWQRGPLASYDARLGDFDQKSASITLTQPLFASGQIQSAVRQATQENERDRQLLDDARRSMVFQVSQTWEQLVLSRTSLVSLAQEVKSTAIALYGVREEEKFALRSTIEILNAQAEATNAQVGFVRARATEYVGRVQLLAATGTLTPDTLSTGVKAYDPVKNFKRVKWVGALPTEIVSRVLDLLSAPDFSKPKGGDTTPIRPPGETLPSVPVDALRATKMPSILDTSDPSPSDAPDAQKK